MTNNEDQNIQDITPSTQEIIEPEIIDDKTYVDDSITKRLKVLQEESIGSLVLSQEDLDTADKNSQLVLSDEVQNKELIDSLKPIFEEYNKKYNTNLTYDNFKSAIQFASLATKEERDIKRVINSEIVSQVTEYIIIKGILVAAKIIDNQINHIQSKAYNQSLTIEAVTMITSIFNWVEKLEVIKEKYSQYNIDTKIKLITGEMNDIGKDNTSLKLIDLLKKSLST